MRRGSNNRETPKGVPSSKNNRQLVTCRPFRDSCMRTKPNSYRHGSYRLGRVYRQGSKTLFHAYGPRGRSYHRVCCYKSGGHITILPLGLLLQVRGRSYHRVCCYKSGGHITILSLGLLLQVRGRSYHRVCCYRSGGSLHRIVTQFRTGSQSLQLWKRQPTCRLDQTVL